MKYVEIALALVFAALGVRSLVYWIRHPFPGRDMTDQFLFALFVTSRAGWWFALAGLFGLYVATARGLVFLRDYDWYLLVLLALAALQFVSGFILGRRTSRG